MARITVPRLKPRVSFSGKQESPTEKEREGLANVLINFVRFVNRAVRKIGMSSRNKIAVFSRDEWFNPYGSCLHL